MVDHFFHYFQFQALRGVRRGYYRGSSLVVILRCERQYSDWDRNGSVYYIVFGIKLIFVLEFRYLARMLIAVIILTL